MKRSYPLIALLVLVGIVLSTVSGVFPVSAQTSLQPVSWWEEKFVARRRSEDATALSRSQNDDSDCYYFLSYDVKAYAVMYEVTGKLAYLDKALLYINNTLDNATTMSDGYLGWISQGGCGGVSGREIPLSESYYWRQVTLMLRIMYEAGLHTDSRYKADYDKILAFSEKHMFEKWYSRGTQHIYRSRTHMASHWAMIAFHLNRLGRNEAQKPRYQEVVNRIDRDLRGQLETVSTPGGPAYIWSAQWGVAANDIPQDTSHGSAFVAYVIEAYQEGSTFWTRQDMLAFKNGMLHIMRRGNEWTEYVNGTGATGASINTGFVELGRFDPVLQDVIENGGVVSYYLASAAMNAKILLGGPAPTPSPSPSPSPSPTPAPGETHTLVPVADTRVREQYPDTNYGTTLYLNTNGTAGQRQEAFQRFSVPDLGGKAVASAKLRLTVSEGSANGPAVHRVSNNGWSETATTWSNRPARDATELGNLGAVTTGQVVEYDVTAAVTGSGLVSFGLWQTSTDQTDFRSRESTTPPQLVITTR